MFLNTKAKAFKTLQNYFKFSSTMPVIEIAKKIQDRLDTEIKNIEAMPKPKSKDDKRIKKEIENFLQKLRQTQDKKNLDELIVWIQKLIVDSKCLVSIYPKLGSYLTNIRKLLDFSLVGLLGYQQDRELCIAKTYQFLNLANKKRKKTVIDWERSEETTYQVNKTFFKKPEDQDITIEHIEQFFNENNITNKAIKDFLLDCANQEQLLSFGLPLNREIIEELSTSFPSTVASSKFKMDIISRGAHEININITLNYNIKDLDIDPKRPLNSTPIPIYVKMLLTEHENRIHLTGIEFFKDSQTEQAITTIKEVKLREKVKESFEKLIAEPDRWLIKAWEGATDERKRKIK